VERQADRAWADWWWLAIVTGVAGLGILVTLSVAVGELGAATALGISIAVQLSVTAAIDHFGWLGVEIQPLSWTRALGILLLIAGARLVVGRG
jgi:transporter family-2 protein